MRYRWFDMTESSGDCAVRELAAAVALGLGIARSLKNKISNSLIFIFFLFVHIRHSQGQCENLFETPQPMRLFKMDSVFNLPDPFIIGTDKQYQLASCVLHHAKRMDDLESELLSKIYFIRVKEFNNLISKTDTNTLNQSIHQLLNILHAARQEEFFYLEVLGYMHLGELLRNHVKFGSALSYDLHAFELLSKLQTSNYLNKYQLAQKIGSTLYDLKEYVPAKEFIEKAITPEKYTMESRKKVLPRYRQFNMLNYDLLSQIHLALGNYDSTQYYIDKAFEIYESEDTTLFHFNGWRGILTGNRGKIFYHKKEYTKAIPLFITGMELAGRANLFNVVGSFSFLLADCYLKSDQPEKVRPLIPIIKNSIHQMNISKNRIRSFEQDHVDYYKLLLLFPESAQSLDRVRTLMDSVTYWNFQLNEKNDKNIQIKRDMEFEIEAFKSKEIALNKRIKAQLLLRNVFFAILFFSFIGIILWMRSKQKQIKAEKIKSAEAQIQANTALEAAQLEMENFKAELIRKNLEIELLENNQETTQINQNLEVIRNKAILTEDDWTNFKGIINKAYPGFIKGVKSKYPIITDGELRTILLLKLKLSTKEMASILGVSTGAIRTMKSRMIKKMNLGENENLANLVESFE